MYVQVKMEVEDREKENSKVVVIADGGGGEVVEARRGDEGEATMLEAKAT